MTPRASRDEFPRVGDLYDEFVPYFEDSVLDPMLMLDDNIRWMHKANQLAEGLQELDVLISRAPDEASASDLLGTWFAQSGLPDGTGYREWLLFTRARVELAINDPSFLPPEGPDQDGFELPRASRFTDLATAEDVCTEVLRAHEQQLRSWAEDRRGWYRQHYYLDLGRDVGEILVRGQDEPVRARAAVLTMLFDVETGDPVIEDAYPELGLDTEARALFPDLCHWFGGYFGQDHRSPCMEIRNANQSTDEPARSRLREQLTDLLKRDDAAIAHVVESCGSYVLPERMRPWVERTLWRLDAFDWANCDFGT